MQRVLSFPNARNFGDAGEFVTKRMCFSFMFAIGFLALLAGFLFGRFSFDQELALTRNRLRQKNLESATEKPATPFLNEPPFGAPLSEEDVQKNQRDLEAARVAANGSQTQAIMIQELLTHSGFDSVSPLRPVSVTLGFPHPNYPNRIQLVGPHKNLINYSFNDCRKGVDLTPEMNVSVASSTIEGDLIYVNFGRPEDYLYLDSIGASASGHVILARVGGLSVADLVATALDHDAVGIVLYLDPEQTNVRPEIITPKELAALKDQLAFLSLATGKTFDTVPILVVSNETARSLFSLLSEKNLAPDSWRGSFINTTYKIGPQFDNPSWTARLEINTAYISEKRYNVVAAIRGLHEPDRLAVIGASLEGNLESPAALMELSKQLGLLKKEKNWRPHRSVVVAFWGESLEKITWLSQDVVAYLDLDSHVSPVTTVLGSPLLQPLFERTASSLALNISYDFHIPLGNAAALNRQGIPFIQVLERLNNNSIDSRTASELGALWGEIAVEIASHEKLPFTLTPFLKFLQHTISSINSRFEVIARRHNLFLETLTLKVTELIDTIKAFNEKWLTTEESPEIAIRAMNDQLISFSHALSCPIMSDSSSDDGQLQLTRHLLFGRSDSESDREAGMGELQDLLRAMTSTDAPKDLQKLTVTLFADTIRCLQNATIALSDKLDIFISGYLPFNSGN